MNSSMDEELKYFKYYGPDDLSLPGYIPRIQDIINSFNRDSQYTTTDILEIHNIQKLLHSIFTLEGCPQEKIDNFKNMSNEIIAKFFKSINTSNVEEELINIPYNFALDLLELIEKHKVYENFKEPILLNLLWSKFIPTDILRYKKLVKYYDSDIKNIMISDSRNAEYIIDKYLEQDKDISLPPSLTPEDMSDLIRRYIDSSSADIRYLMLIGNSPTNKKIGINPKTRHAAKEQCEKIIQEDKDSINIIDQKVSYNISISKDQKETKLVLHSDNIINITYGMSSLDETLDYPSILHNFIHIFEWTDHRCLLNFPSYSSKFRILEKSMLFWGKKDYKTSNYFHGLDKISLCQICIYTNYLSSKGINIEQVIKWFFEEYLVREFKAKGFYFTCPTTSATYLEKTRHLLAEMESIANQFQAYVQEGEINKKLLTYSDPIAYNRIPSLLDKKYIYAKGEDIDSILRILFSDQSPLTYINESLKARNPIQLIFDNKLKYNSFNKYQQPYLDKLFELDLLTTDSNGQIQVTDTPQSEVFISFYEMELSVYYYLSQAGREYADTLQKKEWVTYDSTLLSDPESKYFNYFLNKSEFQNGPNLRNKYLHGSQLEDTEEDHYINYLIVLRLILCLVIKINDEFCLRDKLSPDN